MSKQEFGTVGPGNAGANLHRDQSRAPAQDAPSGVTQGGEFAIIRRSEARGVPPESA